jgi:hypothetical protein
MNIAMGGNFGSDPQYETNGLKNGIDPALSSARMEIAYVRVYKSSSNSSTEEPVDQKDFQKSFFSPNPTSGKIQVHLQSRTPADCTIFNVFGEDILRFQATDVTSEIDISTLSKGLYYVSLQSEGEIIIKKIVLQ